MVRYRDHWTLPGGGTEGAETPEEAAVRELREETGLNGTAVRILYMTTYARGADHGVLVEVPDGQEAVLGYDPELPADGQLLSDVRWFPLADMADDCQVRLVISALKGDA